MEKKKIIPLSKPFLQEEEARFAYETILSGWVTQGPRVQEFEEKFANYVGSEYAVAVSSCTTALHLSLIVAGIEPGDEVICPSFSYIATANSIRYCKANPIFADVNQTYNLDIKDVRKRITNKTKAILLVHQIGFPADLDDFIALCKEFNLILIEDSACALGSEYKNRKIGSHSELSCFSFHPRKVITTGDGGMIATSNLLYYKRLKTLRQHSMSINDRERHNLGGVVFEEYTELGYNYRLTDIQAAVGIRQLERLNELVLERERIALRYLEGFSDLELIALPQVPKKCKTNWQSFMILIKKERIRNQIMEKLLEKGIASRRGIMSIHQEPAYKNFQNIGLYNSEYYTDNCIILPLFNSMTAEDIEYVIGEFREIILSYS